LSACVKPGLLAALAFIDRQQNSIADGNRFAILKLASVPIIESYQERMPALYPLPCCS
jgi:hypothetical protein